jgi:hypothetical protein
MDVLRVSFYLVRLRIYVSNLIFWARGPNKIFALPWSTCSESPGRLEKTRREFLTEAQESFNKSV